MWVSAARVEIAGQAILVWVSTWMGEG